MNKDRINIDDFIREKLGAHTEKDDSSAWLKMKAILDQEMPERVAPIGFRFGKPLAFMAAALLLGVLCVGGYKLASKLDNNEAITVNKTTIANKTNTTSSTTVTNTNTISVSKEKNETNSNPEFAKEHKNVTTSTTKVSEKISSAAKTHNSGAAKEAKHIKDSSDNQLLAVNNVSVAANHSGNRLSLVNSSDFEAAQSKAATSKTSKRKGTQRDVMPDNEQHPSLAQTKIGDKSSNSNAETTQKPTRANRKEKNLHQAANVAGTVSKKATPTLNNGDKTANTKEESETNDSIASISVVSKEVRSKTYPRKTISLIDTIAIEKIAVASDKKTAATTDKKVTAAESNKKDKTTTKDIKLNASQNQVQKKPSVATNSKTKDNNTTTAAESKKKEKKSSLNFLQKMNFPEAIADAKRDLGNAQFYFGFNAGLNYTFNNSSTFQGVHFGPTGELVFNKRWSLFGAINYFNRSGGKKTVNDNYASEVYSGKPDSIIGFNYYFTILTDSTNRYFNFSTLHSFEMPISLKYTINKFCILAGINLAYYLKVNVEDVNKQYDKVNPYVLVTNVAKPILRASSPQLDINDFGTRFGIGYVLGLGYKITPVWQADLRIVNSFWDNATGSGAQRLSKDFYKLPSIQITIGYQFNRVNNRATYSPTSTP
ncbi:MAG: hypothetical protein QM530_00815 [Phycisphaerales bacterium]|nr:hypothetical protein [Phycisphaerales bacterium]